LILRSLRWRLLLGAAAAILIALAVAWLFMTFLFERHLERRLQSEMERDGQRLAAVLLVDAAGAITPTAAPLSDPRLQAPGSGFYWQLSTAAGSVSSRSLLDQSLDQSSPADATGWRLRRAMGPFEAPVFILERTIRPDADRPPVLIQLAQDAADLTSARDEFGRELAVFLGLLWLVLSAAAWAQVTLGLRPLAGIHRDVATLRERPTARLSAARLTEIQPLTDAINAMAEARERDVTRGRQRAADLAHGLKTPIAALEAQSRKARSAGAVDAADGIDRVVASVRSAIDAELARSRIATALAGPPSRTRVLSTVERLIAVLEHTEAGGRIAFTVDIPDDLCAPLRTEDLAELLGAVLENAVRFARRRVWIEGHADPAGVRLVIKDDGPGIAADQRQRALMRGERLDQNGDGSGLGLAIASELAEATGGRVAVADAEPEGLAITFSWAARA
jgi:signal transduction histidine kinase